MSNQASEYIVTVRDPKTGAIEAKVYTTDSIGGRFVRDLPVESDESRLVELEDAE